MAPKGEEDADVLAPLATAPPRLNAMAETVGCALSRISLCRDTNALIRDRSFQAALHRFVGDRQVSWLYPASAYRQMIEVLHGPPDAPVIVPPGVLRFSACRAQSCGEKGSVFLTGDGRIVAVGVLHFHCRPVCDSDYTLSVFALRNAGGNLAALAQAWAKSAIETENATFAALPARRLAQIEITPIAVSDHAHVRRSQPRHPKP